jgi:hypothetical protein
VVQRRLLLGVERTCRSSGPTSEFDPKPSLAMGVARGAAFCYCGFFIVEYRPMEHAMPNSKEIEAKSHNPVPQGYVLGAGEVNT